MTAPPGPDPLLTATPADVERGIARKLLTLGAADSVRAGRLAEVAMTVVGPVLEARDAEIERARADERERCIGWLRTEVTVQRIVAMEVSGPLAEEATAEAAAYEAAIGLLTARANGLMAGRDK